MAWSKRKKEHEKKTTDNSGAEWIQRTSVEEGIESVRKALKDGGVFGEEVDWSLVRAAHIAVMRGVPRKMASLVVRLMERRAVEGKPMWQLPSSSLPVLGISLVRLLAAYLEDSSIPISQARRVAELFLRSIEPHSSLKTVGQIVPMIMAVRTDLAPTGFAPAKRRSGLPVRTEMETSGMCAAAHRQWRVEYLLATGAEDEALDLAHRGRTEKPCDATCAFAPHSMFGWLLEPLHRRGRLEEAAALEDRLASLLTPRLLYLDAMGCRIRYLALVGRFEDANKLLQPMLPLARETMASPWQRLKFYEGCARALELATTADQRLALLTIPEVSPEAVEAEILTARDELRASFASRLP